ncbi:MAG: hypothetical protein IKL55_06420 [Clostridia bacterium]|nr:hypothetical protein [Clostridia bacterium]
MNIGIDIDDTISNTYETLLPYLENYIKNTLGKEFNNQESKIDYYKIQERYGLTQDEENKFWEEYYIKIIESVIPKPLSVETIKKIREKGHKIYLVTARFENPLVNIVAITEKWLKANSVEYDKLIINSHNKLEIAKQENIDIFLDDSIRNCEMISSGNIKTYMILTPNNGFYENGKIEKVNSWNEFYENIKEVI